MHGFRRRNPLKRAIISAAVLALGLAVVSVAAPGPNCNNDYGLCKAYFAGSDQGRENKRNAPPFQALEEAAGVEDDDNAAERDAKVEDFCGAVVGNGPAPGNSDGRGE